MAELSVDYLHNILGVKFFAQLYIDNDFGSSYHTAVINRAAEYDMVVKSVPFRPGAELDEIEDALNQLKDTGYNYFMGIFFSGDYERIMDLAADIGVAGPGRFWMFNGALSSVFVNGVSTFGAGECPWNDCLTCFVRIRNSSPTDQYDATPLIILFRLQRCKGNIWYCYRSRRRWTARSTSI